MWVLGGLAEPGANFSKLAELRGRRQEPLATLTLSTALGTFPSRSRNKPYLLLTYIIFFSIFAIHSQNAMEQVTIVSIFAREKANNKICCLYDLKLNNLHKGSHRGGKVMFF